MLEEIADEESRAALRRAYQNYTSRRRKRSSTGCSAPKATSERRLAILFFAWRIGTDEEALDRLAQKHERQNRAVDVARLFRAYQNPRLTLSRLCLSARHPPARSLVRQRLSQECQICHGTISLPTAAARPRRLVVAAQYSRNHRAQDLRLRIRMERDAFARMTPYWQRLGFPFKTLVPSYATAIGSSSDRPVALAELVGILVNDGVRRPATSTDQNPFRRRTPPMKLCSNQSANTGEQVLAPEVARTVRKAMAEVVEQGTARR